MEGLAPSRATGAMETSPKNGKAFVLNSTDGKIGALLHPWHPRGDSVPHRAL